MADKKIADLQEATTTTDTDILVIQDNANTKKITWANLKTAIIGAFSSILGNRTYTEQNVVTNGESITNSINELDVGLASHKADNVTQGNPHGIDAKANKIQESWVNLTLINSWVNFGDPFFLSGFMKDQFGFVHLRGVITGGTMTNSLVVVTNIPVGYRPAKESIFIVSSYTTSDVLGRVHIATNGDVQLYTGGTGHVSFDGITFQAA